VSEVRAPNPDVTFQRRDPQTYVVLVARAGPEGVLLGTRHFKPAGTDFATELDLFEAGYASVGLAAQALAALGIQERDRLMSQFVEAHKPEEREIALRIVRKLCEATGASRGVG
jgi:hypothetical protein